MRIFLFKKDGLDIMRAEEFSKRSLYPLTRNKELFLEGVERRIPEIVFIGGLTPVERGVIQASGYSIIEA